MMKKAMTETVRSDRMLQRVGDGVSPIPVDRF
ncbi:hypothetical protein RUMTOR_02679 [[Ruminococcus] torques ATCC 27756]|uniref:Uncharacterized protein n=1 Tax=[Ruminococcus] torques ATCC 27756 TaxID=411460 RepID=A5KQY7_9FIRM|nr:hypothetical protein RUMTOR_02679 [[Ruminococcus] torques ATCC 27756]